MRPPQVHRIPVLGAILTVLGCAGDAGSPPPVEEAAWQVGVDGVDTTVPARAAIDAFVPMLGGDPELEALVAQALIEADEAGLVERARQTRGSVPFLREAVRDEGLPDVVIGIPYVESRLRSGVVSPQCAAGPWQFLPEVAVSEGLAVRECALAGDEEAVFSPGRVLPPRGERVYLGAGGCRITSCEVDERRDLQRSTSAAVRHLARIADDPALAEHPQRVPLTVLSFNAGLGGVQRLLRLTGDEPFDVVPACATGDCLVLAHEQAWYVPRVVAAAAIVSCNATDPADPAVADWARSELCGAMHAAGLGPEPVTSAQALAAAAEGWTIGLTSLDVQAPGLDVQRHAVEVRLASRVAAIPGVTLVQGVPGESPEALVEQGADVVLVGTLGRFGERAWVRLDRWRPDAAPEDAGFAVLEGAIDDRLVEDLLADALLRPVQDRRADAIEAVVRSRREMLVACLPAVVDGLDEPVASISLRVDAAGRPAAVSVAPGAIDPTVRGCIEGRLSDLAFPPELANAGTTLQVSVEAPVVADAAP